MEVISTGDSIRELLASLKWITREYTEHRCPEHI